jgi:hypothetical protein
MTTETKDKKPDYKGDGIAVWVNKDKNGKPYLSVKLVGHTAINAWLNDKDVQP